MQSPDLQEMRKDAGMRKMWASCNGVCLLQTPIFVKTHVDLLTPSLCSRGYKTMETFGPPTVRQEDDRWVRHQQQEGRDPATTSKRAGVILPSRDRVGHAFGVRGACKAHTRSTGGKAHHLPSSRVSAPKWTGVAMGLSSPLLQRPPPPSQVSSTVVPPPPPRAQEPAMFDRGTRGWFLRMTVGSPVPRKKKFPARCAATSVPSPFPQLTTLTNEHQKIDGGTHSNTHEMLSCTLE